MAVTSPRAARTLGVLALTLGLARVHVGHLRPRHRRCADDDRADGEARTIEQAEAATQSMMDLYAESMTGVVVTVRVGEQTATVTAGLADTKAERPMKADTRLQMASNTKMLVATLVMQEVESGEIAA